MDDRTQLNLIRGIKSGLFTDRQSLEAFRALRSDDDQAAADLIGSLSFASLNSGKSLSEMVDERQGRDRENFDYTSGADGRLRSLMSFGETEGDREAILASLVGEDGYVRDPSGKLALTEKGQIERGMDPVGKNLVIEDEGFSMRDVADFAGILPETIGSIGGAIAGGGLTFGVGSVAGAGAGAAAGQAIEESLEQLLGVQTQDLGEVARDVAIEGAIGAGGELIGAAVLAAGRGVVGGGARAARSIAGRSPAQELAADRLARMESLVQRGYVPSLEAMGAPKPTAYAQKFFENAGKVDSRIKNNIEKALLQKQDFLKDIKGDPSSALGEDVMWYAPGQFAKLKNARDEAQKNIIKAIDDSINLLSTSIDEGVDLNKTSLGRITGAFDTFSNETTKNFEAIGDMLSQIQTPVTLASGRQVMKEGGDLKVFNVKSLQNSLTDYMNEMRNLADPAAQQAEIFLRGTNGNASFKEMSNLRKAINDSLYFGGNVSTKARGVLEDLRGQIDTMMDGTNILDDIRVNTSGLTPNEKKILQAAAKQREFAISSFREGMKKFDELSRLGIIRSIRDIQRLGDYDPRGVADQFYSRIVKPDSPDRLSAVLEVVDNPNELRDMFARRYLEDALEVAGRDPLNPEYFNGRAFEKYINKLKSTGPELFGSEWGAVRRAAKEIGNASAKESITIDDVLRVSDVSGGGKIADKMNDLVSAQSKMTDALKTSVIKDIQSGRYENYDSVVRALTNPKLTQDEVLKIMRFFDNQPQLKQNMKEVVLQNILSVVDDQVFSSPAAAKSLKETLDKYKPGTLKQILGKETYEALSGFSDDLIDLSDVGKEGAIAAGSLWANVLKHPFSTLGAITKFKVLAKAMGNPSVAKAFLRARRAAGSSEQMRADAMIGMMNEAMLEEGVDVAGAASRVGRAAQGIGNIAGQSGRVNRQVVPRALGLGSAEQPGQTRTSVRQTRTQIPQIDIPEMPEAAARPASAPSSPIDMLRQNVQSEIRRRARENPAVASTLLGGLGNADLL